MKVGMYCQIEGCSKRYHAKGYCANHYMKFLKYGDATTVVCKTPYGEPLAWLIRHIEHSDKNVCLIWPYSKDTHGRGQVSFGGKLHQAHRLMCTWNKGEPPFEEAVASHSCGKGHDACVNPNHLNWSSHIDNQNDRIKHGTTNRGENHGASKLTKQDVKEIRDLRGYYSCRALAKMYGITAGTISQVQNNRTWL